jgi:hypothetical protein
MVEDFIEQIKNQEETLIELEDELEMEISRVIALKNSIDPELIEDLEKIEEGLYVEVKMISETKKHIDNILNNFKNPDGSLRNGSFINQVEIEGYMKDIDKYKRRSEKLAKQLIQANEEIENMNIKMKAEIKAKEHKLKNEFINQMKEKENNTSNQIMDAKRREEELIRELEGYRSAGEQGGEEMERMREFFDKKIQNIKNTMSEDFTKREKNIAEKAIVVYNKKKEKIYTSAMKDVLSMNSRPSEIDQLLQTLRVELSLADDVYDIENYFLCNKCSEVIHISQSKCPNCKAKVRFK